MHDPKEVEAVRSALESIIDRVPAVDASQARIREIRAGWLTEAAITALAPFRAAELAAARAEGWQPIESAPKDGTFVLLWDECVAPAPTVDRSGFVRTGRFTHPLTGGTGWGCVERRRVTHWQPLPAPPSAIAEARP